MKKYDNYDYEEAYKIDLQEDIDKKARAALKVNANPDLDFEEQWKRQQDNLREWEYERLIREGKVEGQYRTTTTKSRNIKTGKVLLESQIYPSFYHRTDVPRTKRRRETKPAQKNLNSKNSIRQLARLININFGPDDLWCTFGWNDSHMPEEEKAARRDITNWIKRINRRRKKAGRENIKYIYVLAFEEYVRPHFHIIMTGDGVDRDEIERLWGKCQRVNTRRIKPDEDFLNFGLALYIARNPHGKKRWASSKNLKRPDKPTRSYAKFKKRTVQEMARDHEILKAAMEKAYPGYRFLDAEVMYNGIAAAFYIYARMVRD